MPGNLSLGSKRSHKIIIVVIYRTKNVYEKLLLVHFHLFPFTLSHCVPVFLPKHVCRPIRWLLQLTHILL